MGHYRTASETPLQWRFAGGSIVAQDCMRAGYCICESAFSNVTSGATCLNFGSSFHLHSYFVNATGLSLFNNAIRRQSKSLYCGCSLALTSH